MLTAGVGVPEDRYFPVFFSWDSCQLLVVLMHQRTRQDLYGVDLVTGQVRLLTPHSGPAKYLAAAWRPEGIYVCAAHDRDFTGLALQLDASGERLFVLDGADALWAVSLADGRAARIAQGYGASRP